MSQIDRAVEVMKRLEVLVPEHQFRAALRAYQAPRVWAVEELEALPDDALLADSDLRVKAAWQWAERAKLAPPLRPLRLVFNPDDVEEDA